MPNAWKVLEPAVANWMNVPEKTLRILAICVLALSLGLPALNAHSMATCEEIPGVRDRCPLWTVDIDKGRGDVPTGAAVSPDGLTLFVTSLSGDGNTGDVDTFTTALTVTTGAERWVAREEGPGPTDPNVSDLAVAPDGEQVFVVGVTNWGGNECDPNPCSDAFAAAYDADTGARLWKRVLDGPVGGWEYLSGIAVSPDSSRVFVTGASQGIHNDPGFAGAFDRATLDVSTMALDASDGETVWSARYDRVPGEYDAAYSIALSPDGRLVFVGANTAGALADDGDSDYLTLAYDSGSVDDETAGALLWVSRLDSAVPKDLVLPWDVATDLAVSPDGSNVYVTGLLGANRPSSGAELFYNPATDYGTVAYDASDGEQRWLARYPGVAGGYNIAQDLALSPSGDRVYVTGISSGVGWENTNDRDAAVVAYGTTDGSEKWTTAYVPGYAYGWQLAPRESEVFLAASSTEYSVTQDLSAADGSTEWQSTSLPLSETDAIDHLEARMILATADRLFTLGVAYPFVSFGDSNARVQAFAI